MEIGEMVGDDVTVQESGWPDRTVLDPVGIGVNGRVAHGLESLPLIVIPRLLLATPGERRDPSGKPLNGLGGIPFLFLCSFSCRVENLFMFRASQTEAERSPIRFSCS